MTGRRLYNGSLISTVSKLGKIFTCPTYTLELYDHFRCLHVLCSKYNYIHQVLSYSMDFKASQDLWDPLSKAVPGKFHGSGGHTKHDLLQDWANFHRSRAWQIVLFFNTDIVFFIHGDGKLYGDIYLSWQGCWLDIAQRGCSGSCSIWNDLGNHSLVDWPHLEGQTITHSVRRQTAVYPAGKTDWQRYRQSGRHLNRNRNRCITENVGSI